MTWLADVTAAAAWLWKFVGAQVRLAKPPDLVNTSVSDLLLPESQSPPTSTTVSLPAETATCSRRPCLLPPATFDHVPCVESNSAAAEASWPPLFVPPVRRTSPPERSVARAPTSEAAS